jgi:hypothetical protein
MSWDCPHQSENGSDCDRLGGPCKPLGRGCVLYGNGQLLGIEQEATPMNTPEQNDAENGKLTKGTP